MQTVTRYAKSGDVHVAYQVFGEGPVDVIAVLPFVSNIETFWDEPELARWLRYLGGRVRLTMFDKRGTGMSDRVGALPGMDERMDDVRAVMDAAGIQATQRILVGALKGLPGRCMQRASRFRPKSGERLRNYRNSIGPPVAVRSQTTVYLTGTPLPTQQD